ncbi:hypothetical protein [Virgibacillus dokdonensis]|uniref:hypothetical protein n=1 Tax=Virgibacillus dokdonensis TaxID=302167 RepID=UPI0015907766|nr:hypothetical protein [Virgibacillus dokdonensis]
MTRDYAGRFIRIYEELGNSNYVSGRNLGIKALYEIAQIPVKEREKEHTLSSGDAKTVDEMTVSSRRRKDVFPTYWNKRTLSYHNPTGNDSGRIKPHTRKQIAYPCGYVPTLASLTEWIYLRCSYPQSAAFLNGATLPFSTPH